MEENCYNVSSWNIYRGIAAAEDSVSSCNSTYIYIQMVSEEYKNGESDIGKENPLASKDKGTASVARHETWLQQLKWSRVLEIILLSCVILVVLGVFATPTIFFALSQRLVDTKV